MGACTERQIRLVGGSSPLEGRVELCLGGVWGTITDDSWDTNDAKVVCKELGFLEGCELVNLSSLILALYL